jgi:hypothetical protein
VPVDLFKLFEALVLPLDKPSPRNFSAIGIPGFEGHRIAKDANGSPCLLLKQATFTTGSAPILLENLSASYGIPCAITHPDGRKEEATFTIVKCSSSDPSLFPHFLRILSPVIATLGSGPSSAAVRNAILGLVELFRALTAPARKSIQGLWAELFLMAKASDPAAVVAAWHGMPSEHIDFVGDRQRVEVKSSSTRQRIHYFSLLQVTPPGETKVVVASMFVERAGGGLSLGDLYDQIRSQLIGDPPSLVRFDATFYSTLGANWLDAMDEAFDADLATESLGFFDVSEVPRIAGPIPEGVGDVRFTSDLSRATPIPMDSMKKARGLLAAIAPGA